MSQSQQYNLVKLISCKKMSNVSPDEDNYDRANNNFGPNKISELVSVVLVYNVSVHQFLHTLKIHMRGKVRRGI